MNQRHKTLDYIQNDCTFFVGYKSSRKLTPEQEQFISSYMTETAKENGFDLRFHTIKNGCVFFSVKCYPFALMEVVSAMKGGSTAALKQKFNIPPRIGIFYRDLIVTTSYDPQTFDDFFNEVPRK